MSTIAPIYWNSTGSADPTRQNSPSSGGFEKFLPAADGRDVNAAAAFLPGGASSGGVVISGQLPPDGLPYEPTPPTPDGLPYEPTPPRPDGLPYEPTPPRPDGLPYEPTPPRPDGLPYEPTPPTPDGMPYQPTTPPGDGLPYHRASLPADGLPYQRNTPPADGAPYEPVRVGATPDAPPYEHASYQSALDSAGQGLLQQSVAQALDRFAGEFAAAGSVTATAGGGAASASDLLLANRLWAESQAASAARSIGESASDLVLQGRLR